MQTNTNPDDVIVFRKPRGLAMFASRPAAAYDVAHPDRQDLRRFLCQIKARYVVTTADDCQFWDQSAAAGWTTFEPIYRNLQFRGLQGCIPFLLICRASQIALTIFWHD